MKSWVLSILVGLGLSLVVAVNFWLLEWQRDFNDRQQLDQQILSKQQDLNNIKAELVTLPWLKKRLAHLHAKEPVAAAVPTHMAGPFAAWLTRHRLRLIRCTLVGDHTHPTGPDPWPLWSPLELAYQDYQVVASGDPAALALALSRNDVRWPAVVRSVKVKGDIAMLWRVYRPAGLQ